MQLAKSGGNGDEWPHSLSSLWLDETLSAEAKEQTGGHEGSELVYSDLTVGTP